MSIKETLTSGPLGFGSTPLRNMLRSIHEDETAATVDAARQSGRPLHAARSRAHTAAPDGHSEL
jgi:hypothetical protein